MERGTGYLVVKLCSAEIHERLSHAEHYMSDIERPTRRQLKDSLTADFEVFEGFSGNHKHGGERVYYDLVARPRQHLVDQGFAGGHFIIEVKLFNSTDKAKHDVKARDMLWQCVAYSFSEIELPDGKLERPLFVLYSLGGTGFNPLHLNEIGTLHHFVQRGGVGQLIFEPRLGWSMRFGGTRYFSKAGGKGPHNVGVKRQTGSSR